MSRKWIAALGFGGFLVGACGSIGGVADFVNVDCVADCGVDGGPTTLEGNADGSSDGSATADATPCVAGSSLVTLDNKGGSQSLTGNSSALDARAGSTDAACIPNGTTLTVSVSGGGGDTKGTFAGVACSDGNQDATRCQFVVDGPVTVSFTSSSH